MMVSVVAACNRNPSPSPQPDLVEPAIPTNVVVAETETPSANVAVEVVPTIQETVQAIPPAEATAEVESQLPDLAGRAINIAVENAYLPFNYIELATGQAGGWDYEVWNEICRRLNCVPHYVETRWDGMIEAVSRGEFDVAADGIVILEERARLVDFSTGYLNIEQRFLARADEDRFATPEELQSNQDLIVGVQTGTVNYTTAEELVGLNRVQSFAGLEQAVQALLADEVDVVIMDEIGGQGYGGPDADKLKLVGPPLSIDQFGFAYPKGSDLIEPVNLALASMQADGFLDKLAEKYFSNQFTLTDNDIGPGAYTQDE
ncbi:MAG: amino acid ABC transporter substrate-binding protein [Anaerolineae bacterium]|nr:amino acid ABC transporter substrate-binding protein [Anaerolineae bacterium]